MGVEGLSCLLFLAGFFTCLKSVLSGVSRDMTSELRHSPVSVQTAHRAGVGWQVMALRGWAFSPHPTAPDIDNSAHPETPSPLLESAPLGFLSL